MPRMKSAPSAGTEDRPWEQADPEQKRRLLIQLPADYKAALEWLARDEAPVIKSQAGWVQRLAMERIDELVEQQTGAPVRAEDE